VESTPRRKLGAELLELVLMDIELAPRGEARAIVQPESAGHDCSCLKTRWRRKMKQDRAWLGAAMASPTKPQLSSHSTRSVYTSA
jgi:hypothetical protein